MRIIFADTETTGLDIERHEPWEFGAIIGDTDDLGGPVERVELAWWPRHLETADPQALQMNGFYERMPQLKHDGKLSSPSFVASFIAEFSVNSLWVGNNPAFDCEMLTKFCRDNGHVFAPFHRKINVVDLGIGALKERMNRDDIGLGEYEVIEEALRLPHSSSKVLNTAGCPKNKAEHTAMGDAEHVYKAFLHLWGVSA